MHNSILPVAARLTCTTSAFNFICAQRVKKKTASGIAVVQSETLKRKFITCANVSRQRQAMSDAQKLYIEARASCKRIKIYSTLACGIKMKEKEWVEMWGWKSSAHGKKKKIIKFIISCGWDWELFPAGGTTKQNCNNNDKELGRDGKRMKKKTA